jgi:hypothetical protein
MDETVPPCKLLYDTTATATGGARPTPPARYPAVADAFAHLVPAGGVTVAVGSTFTLDLYLNSGSHPVISQQSYLTFTQTLWQVVLPGQSAGATAGVVEDPTTFGQTLQNRVNNTTGEIAYASGTLKAPAGSRRDFRVARLTLAAIAPGTAILRWPLQPPPGPHQDSAITDLWGRLVANPALYQDVVVQILPGARTPSSK